MFGLCDSDSCCSVVFYQTTCLTRIRINRKLSVVCTVRMEPSFFLPLKVNFSFWCHFCIYYFLYKSTILVVVVWPHWFTRPSLILAKFISKGNLLADGTFVWINNFLLCLTKTRTSDCTTPPEDVSTCGEPWRLVMSAGVCWMSASPPMPIMCSTPAGLTTVRSVDLYKCLR